MGHVNKTIVHTKKAIKYEELRRNNKTTMGVDKYKHTLCMYDIKGYKNTESTSEKKEKAWDGYFNIYECSKLFCTSTLERVCEAQETVTSQIKEILESFNSKTKELIAKTETYKVISIVVTKNQKYMQLIRNRALHISITLRTLRSIVILQHIQRRNKMGERKIVRNIIRPLLMKMRKIRLLLQAKKLKQTRAIKLNK